MRIDPVRLSPLRSGAFRFAVLLAAVFAAAAALLLLVVQEQVGRYAQEAAATSLRTEETVLQGEYRTGGLPGVIGAIKRRQGGSDEAQFQYLLTDKSGHRLYGDLPASAAGLGLTVLRLPGEEGEGPQVVTRLGTALPGAGLLVVASDTFDIQDMRRRLAAFTIASGAAVTLFALIGGFLVGRLFLRRLDGVNAAVDRIIDGDLAERLPAIGLSPEFDRLSANLNRMLDRNALLMDSLRQVSTDIAHDLRTPLTRLHQQLQQIRDEGDRGADGIEAALVQTENLLAIFQALLRIGALEGGVGRRRFAAVDLSEVMDRVHLAYAPVAEDAGHSLVAEHAPGILVNGDPDLLAQLFTNLVENALVHTPAGTRVTTRLTSTGVGVLAEVCDDGPGIPEEERDKVFQRFYRRDASRNTPGAGLGLALVGAIAALHGAAIRVEDNRPGLRIKIVFQSLAHPDYTPA